MAIVGPVFAASKLKEITTPKSRVFPVDQKGPLTAEESVVLEEYVKEMINNMAPAAMLGTKIVGPAKTVGAKLTPEQLDQMLQKIERTPEIQLNLDTLKASYGKLKDWTTRKEAIEPLRQALKSAGVPREHSYPAAFRMVEKWLMKK